jgi:hypothetical protein
MRRFPGYPIDDVFVWLSIVRFLRGFFGYVVDFATCQFEAVDESVETLKVSGYSACLKGIVHDLIADGMVQFD